MRGCEIGNDRDGREGWRDFRCVHPGNRATPPFAQPSREQDGGTLLLEHDMGEDRLRADHELYCHLLRGGFAGKDWDVFAAALFNYGYQVLRAWIHSGQMFTKARCSRMGPSIPLDVAEELAIETLGEALGGFRDDVLIPGRWDPTLGASLTTYFTGCCILRFPNVYRRHLRSDERWSKALAGADQACSTDDRGNLADPAAQVDLTASVLEELRQLPTKTGEIVVLRDMGYTHSEIAEITGLTIGAIEARMYRLGHRPRKQHD